MNILIAGERDIGTAHRVVMWANECSDVRVAYVSQAQILLDILGAKLPDVLFIDPEWEQFDLWETIDEIVRRHTTLAIVVYSELSEYVFGQRYLRMGVRGFLQKSDDSAGFYACLTAMRNGERYMSLNFYDFILGVSPKYQKICTLSAFNKKGIKNLISVQSKIALF